MRLYFVRGHCGWDVVTLLLAREVPAGEQLSTALKVLDHPVNGGIEVGLLERTEVPGDIRLRITDGMTRDWLAMCGGMTQVIGKALIETAMRDHFGIDVSAPTVQVRLITEACVIPVSIEVADRRARSVTTTMDTYAALLYSLGVGPVVLDGIAGLDVGEYLVVRLADLEAAHAGVDFTRRDPGPHLDIVNHMLESYRRHRGHPRGACAMLYDDRPEGSGQFRIFPRFHEIDETAARLPYEFQCGTGTIALAVALAHAGALPFAGERGSFVIEWGSQCATPDPFGIRTSRVDVELQQGRVAGVTFSHSVIEIVAEGLLRIPGTGAGGHAAPP